MRFEIRKGFFWSSIFDKVTMDFLNTDDLVKIANNLDIEVTRQKAISEMFKNQFSDAEKFSMLIDDVSRNFKRRYNMNATDELLLDSFCQALKKRLEL